MSKPLAELLKVEDPAWPHVAEWIQAAEVRVEVLASDERLRAEVLLESQLTLRSPVGAVVYNTGGILVDSGWLRILGSGHARFGRSLASWNQECASAAADHTLGFLLIADDVVGGFFALNGGAFDAEPGQVFYFAPDALRWETLKGMGYSEFLAWSFSSRIKSFYQNMYWPGWESEVAALTGDQALAIYPFPCTVEGKNIAACGRRPCPVGEIFALNVFELPKQLLSTAE